MRLSARGSAARSCPWRSLGGAAPGARVGFAVACQWGDGWPVVLLGNRRNASPDSESVGLLLEKSLPIALRLDDMLQAMQQAAAAPPAPPYQSFADLLAVLDAPPRPRRTRTLFFPEFRGTAGRSGCAPLRRGGPRTRLERRWLRRRLCNPQLRARLARPRALPFQPIATPSATDSSLTQLADAWPIRASEAFPAASPPAAATATPQAAASSHGDVQPRTAFGLPTALNRNLKSASITIRLSKAECAQLRRRAAEAGLTVSAYLRSCTFEAESLRAEVAIRRYAVFLGCRVRIATSARRDSASKVQERR